MGVGPQRNRSEFAAVTTTVSNMTFTRMTLTATAAALLMLGSTTNANAATLEIDNMTGISSTPSCQALSSHPAGSACYHADGDYFYLHDASGPGKVVVQWKLESGARAGLIRWGASAQFTNGVKNKDLPENNRVGIRFGVCMNTRCDRLSDVNFQASTWKWANT